MEFVPETQTGPWKSSGQGARRASRRAPPEEPSPGSSEQCRQTTGPPGFLPCPHRLPCQRQRVCETLSGGQWELEGPPGSLAVVALFLHSPGEDGFLMTAIHTVIGPSCCGGPAPGGGPTTARLLASGPRGSSLLTHISWAPSDAGTSWTQRKGGLCG